MHVYHKTDLNKKNFHQYLISGHYPREHWNMVTYDRWSLYTGLSNMKCTVNGN